VGWEGLVDRAGAPVPFDAGHLEVLDEVLTEKELWELYWAGGSDLDEADRAFFESRPSSSPAASASQESKAATPESA
jgi:hypothetical protein